MIAKVGVGDEAAVLEFNADLVAVDARLRQFGTGGVVAVVLAADLVSDKADDVRFLSHDVYSPDTLVNLAPIVGGITGGGGVLHALFTGRGARNSIGQISVG